jgi:WD40 repeat protein
MKTERPQFELTRVYSDETAEAPEIVPVTRMPWDTRMSRRGALGVGLGAAAALFLLDARGEPLRRTYQSENLLKAPEKTLLAHLNEVSALALTPDGKMLVSGSHDNTVKFWSLPEGGYLTTLPIHTDNVTELDISPDGKTLVSVCADTLRLWTLPEGQLRAVLDEHTGLINAVAFTPDGKMLISGGNDKTIRLWSLPEGRLLTTLEGNPGAVQFLALTPNGKLLASGGKENSLKLWSLPEGRLLMTLGRYSTAHLAFSPDSRMIALGSYDIELRSLADGRLLTTLKPGENTTSLAVSPDGKMLASVSAQSLRLWSLPDGKLLRKVEKAGHNITDLAISADNRMLLSIGRYDATRLWSLPEGQPLAQLQAGDQTSVARFTRDGQHLLTGGRSGSITLWGLGPPNFQRYFSDPVFTAGKSPDKPLLAHNDAVTALAASADGKLLASSSNDDTAKLWSLPGGQLLATLEGHKENLSDVVITPDGRTIITASNDRTIRLWALPDVAQSTPPPALKADKKLALKTAKPVIGKSAPKGRLLATLEGHQVSPRRLSLSADGKTLVSTDSSGVIHVWGLPEGRLLATLQEQRNTLQALAITPDGRLLVTTTENRDDRAVKLWALPEGRLIATLAGQAGQVKTLAIAPDGKLLAAGADDHSIRLWELPGGRLLGSLEEITATSLAITPDGKLLAAGSASGIRLWSIAEGRLLATLEERRQEGYGPGAASLAFAQDGRLLLSWTANGGINLWSLPAGRLLARIETQATSTEAIAISPDGRTLACGDYSGVIALWDLEKPGFRAFLFDAAVNSSETKGLSYNVYDQVTGQTITYTLPCGSPIPPGAVCTCNCVPGTERAYRPPAPPRRSGGGGYGGGRICTCNKVCTCIPVPSDRNLKEAFEATDPLLILQRLSGLSIQTWNYKWNDTAIRHIGPMAQDFAAAFGVGEDDKHISPVDAQGVAFAAIQGLYRVMKEKEAVIQTLQVQLRRQQEMNETLNARLDEIEGLVKDRLTG